MGHPKDELNVEAGGSDRQSFEDEYSEFPPPPPYADAEGRTIVPATTKFPPAMNAYFRWKITRTFHLGPSADQKLFAASAHTGGFTGKKPMIILHNGPSDKDEVLATSGSETLLQTRFAIKLAPRAGETAETVIQMSGATLIHPTYKFTMPVGDKSQGVQSEEFEWRSSVGKEVMKLAKGPSWGWKLVRCSGPNTRAGGSGLLKNNPGFTSDGREVVALMALNGTASMTKAVRFTFMGSGLTGTMGETWEIVALTSALQIWDVYYQSWGI